MYPHTGEGNQPRRTRRLRRAFDHRAAHHSLCVSPCCVVTYLSPALPPEPNGSVRTTQMIVWCLICMFGMTCHCPGI